MKFVDSHAHIDGPEFDSDRDEVVSRARLAGVAAILTVGTGDPESGALERAAAVAEHYDGVFAAVGIHPHDAKLYGDDVVQQIVQIVEKRERVVAIGEIGLDYYYDHSPRDIQQVVFRRQLQLARELKLPVIVHSRDAEVDTLEIIREEWNQGALAGIMHCFGGSAETALNLIELGFFISFAGNLTFKNAGNLRDSARALPLDRLLIETDCPYLTPVPFRGKRNEPSRVVEVARCLSEIHGVSLESMGRRTSDNFCLAFRVAI
jgi:TatD DNase family protein